MTTPLEAGAARARLDTPEKIVLAAQVEALRRARDAVAGDVVGSYGRIDGLLLECQDRLARLCAPAAH
jgi:hypothetical protein